MKVAYFGIDALQDCLHVLLEHGCEIVSVFTIEDDEYDHSAQLCRFAESHQIPFQTTRVTKEDIRKLEEEGVSLSITAGYPWKIPLSRKIRQLNLHPALLPIGRGAWPMPVALLRGCSSGVTLHKLTEAFDEGDIVLQEEIIPDEKETLITLTDKIAKTAAKLVDEFLDQPQLLWENARPQKEGEYWEEPSDKDRTILPTDSCALADRKLRAFDGYGCLCEVYGVTIVVEKGSCQFGKMVSEQGSLTFSLADGFLTIQKWHPYFREITLADRTVMEEIRRRYPSELSDYTFALLYCWRKVLNLQVHIGNAFFLIRSGEKYFCPIGDPEEYAAYLKGLCQLEGSLQLAFCDERYAQQIETIFPRQTQRTQEMDDSDYLIRNEQLDTLSGGEMNRRRNDYHHYQALDQAPQTERLTKENLHQAALLAEQSKREDYRAQKEAIRHFEQLGLCGVLVKRGERYVSFAIASQKEPDVMQGHFSKTVEEERGASLFVVRACSVQEMDRYQYTNLEDDMGVSGLRSFKQSLHAQRIPAYTIRIKAAEDRLTDAKW